MSRLLTLFGRHFIFNKTLKEQARHKLHNTKSKAPPESGGVKFDQYRTHSPLQTSRYKVEELKSRIFLEHPPVPNRIPKLIFAFILMSMVSGGVRHRVVRRHKAFTREQERNLFRQILPFVQAMEDVRFTAIEQRRYMIEKAISDINYPGHFDKIRKRFNQEDI